MTPKIVIVGGGAGGLVLATKLGDRLGRKGRAEVVLIDPELIHVWKPLYHEVAAGTLSPAEDSVIYLGHAKAHAFRFVHGRLGGLDRANRLVRLAPERYRDGVELPERTVPYDILVIAIGSIGNDFGVPGVEEHCVFLDSQDQAVDLQQRILADFLVAQASEPGRQRELLSIAIIGGGATGVELAAELHNAARQLVAFGLDRIEPERDVRLSVIEAADRVVPALPERLSRDARAQLERLGVTVLTGETVDRVSAEAVHTRSGRVIQAHLKIWCAGIRSPEIIRHLDGLEVSRRGQLVVDDHLRTTREAAIYAIGDCAHCPQPGTDQPLPPRAQTAYQQAIYLASAIPRRLDGQEGGPFVYKDYGSLLSLSYSAVGSLMGSLFGRVTLEGWLARLAYASLYRRHQLALHGFWWVLLKMLSERLVRSTRPQLKLH
jgi:NADH dehydrogenase